MNVRLYVLQRATAAIMAPLVLAHLGDLLRHQPGLERRRHPGANAGAHRLGTFYGLFVLAAATHGAIGVRAVADEWAAGGRPSTSLMWSFGSCWRPSGCGRLWR